MDKIELMAEYNRAVLFGEIYDSKPATQKGQSAVRIGRGKNAGKYFIRGSKGGGAPAAKAKEKEQPKAEPKAETSNKKKYIDKEFTGLNNNVNNGLDQDNRNALNKINNILNGSSPLEYIGHSEGGEATKATGITSKGNAQITKTNDNSFEIRFKNKTLKSNIETTAVMHFKTKEDMLKAQKIIENKLKPKAEKTKAGKGAWESGEPSADIPGSHSARYKKAVKKLKEGRGAKPKNDDGLPMEVIWQREAKAKQKVAKSTAEADKKMGLSNLVMASKNVREFNRRATAAGYKPIEKKLTPRQAKMKQNREAKKQVRLVAKTQ